MLIVAGAWHLVGMALKWQLKPSLVPRAQDRDGSLRPQSLPLMAHLFQQGHTSCPSQTVLSTGDQIVKFINLIQTAKFDSLVL